MMSFSLLIGLKIALTAIIVVLFVSVLKKYILEDSIFKTKVFFIKNPDMCYLLIFFLTIILRPTGASCNFLGDLVWNALLREEPANPEDLPPKIQEPANSEDLLDKMMEPIKSFAGLLISEPVAVEKQNDEITDWVPNPIKSISGVLLSPELDFFSESESSEEGEEPVAELDYLFSFYTDFTDYMYSLGDINNEVLQKTALNYIEKNFPSDLLAKDLNQFNDKNSNVNCFQENISNLILENPSFTSKDLHNLIIIRSAIKTYNKCKINDTLLDETIMEKEYMTYFIEFANYYAKFL